MAPAAPELAVLPVDPIGQITLRAYTRTILVFPFPDHMRRSQAELQLRLSLQQLLRRWPFLHGHVVLCEEADAHDHAAGTATVSATVSESAGNGRDRAEARKSGRVEVRDDRRPTGADDAVGRVFEARELSRSEFPHDYDALAADGMPPTAFPAAVFFDTPTAQLGGVKQLPVLRTKACFFRGGLALSLANYHAAMDGAARSYVVETWAALCHGLRAVEPDRLLQLGGAGGGAGAEQLDVLGPWSRFRADGEAKDKEQEGFQEMLDRSPECYVDEGSKRAVGGNTPEATSRLFVFSDRFVRKLKADLNESWMAAKALDAIAKRADIAVSHEQPLSSYCCLSAFLWWHVLQARSPHLDADAQSSFLAMVNLRGRFVPAGHFPGNAIVNAMATVAVGEGTSPSALVVLRLALAIRQAIDDIDEDFVRRRVRLCDAAPDVRTLNFRVAHDERRRTTDLALNDWTRFGMDCPWSIAGTATAHARWCRKPWSADIGYGVVMPRRCEASDRGADWEVFLGFETRDEKVLVESLEKCCTRIVE